MTAFLNEGGPMKVLSIPPRRLLLLTLMANAAGHTFFIISFPALARTLGFTDPQAGMVMGLSALVMTLAAPAWGASCERRGRRPTFLSGVLIAVSFFFAAAVVLYFRSLGVISIGFCMSLLLLARTLSTLGSAAVMPSAQAYMADITEPAQRTMGMAQLGAAFGAGSVLGSSIAMFAGIDFIWIGFGLCTVLVVISMLICWRLLPEPLRPCVENRVSIAVEIKQIIIFLAVTLLGLATYSLVQHVATLRLQDGFGYSAHDSLRIGGAAMTSAMVIMILTQLWVLPRLNMFARQSLLLGTLVCLGCLLLSLIDHLNIFLFSIAALGAGLGLLLSSNLGLLSLVSGPDTQARNAGINGLAQGIGMAMGPLLGANLQAQSYLAPWFAACVLMSIVLLISIRVHALTASITA